LGIARFETEQRGLMMKDRLNARRSATAYAKVLTWAVHAALVAVASNVAMSAPSPSEVELTTTVIAGLQNHLESLRSGIVDFEVSNKDGAVLWKRCVVFDNERERIRCEMEACLGDHRVARVLHTKSEFLQFASFPQGGVLTRLNPGEESRVSDGMPIDARAMGLCQYSVLNRSGANAARAVLSNLQKRQLLSAVVKDEIALVVWLPEPNTQTAWWFDTRHGFVPIRSEVRMISPVGVSVIRQRLETSWGRVKDVYVPEQSTFQVLNIDGSTASSEQIRFAWKSVNEKVPEELFTAESLKVPKNTYVVDNRLGQPILEEVLGRQKRFPEPPAPGRLHAFRLVLALGLPLLLLLAWALLVLARRRRRRTASS
jgi:hypothetical protein